MKKIDLKKLKGSLSRDEQRTIKGGYIKPDNGGSMGCACTNAACVSQNKTGDSYCNGTHCC